MFSQSRFKFLHDAINVYTLQKQQKPTSIDNFSHSVCILRITFFMIEILSHGRTTKYMTTDIFQSDFHLSLFYSEQLPLFCERQFCLLSRGWKVPRINYAIHYLQYLPLFFSIAYLPSFCPFSFFSFLVLEIEHRVSHAGHVLYHTISLASIIGIGLFIHSVSIYEVPLGT